MARHAGAGLGRSRGTWRRGRGCVDTARVIIGTGSNRRGGGNLRDGSGLVDGSLLSLSLLSLGDLSIRRVVVVGKIWGSRWATV